MNGLLIINKPIGLTSFDVVAKVRKLAHERRIGHAGTLDPLATGVLPLALGKATRVIEYLSEAGKEYEAGVMFGGVSATYDREGPLELDPDAVLPTEQDLLAALDGFRGPISQLPPMHSAVKHQGKRLYELARAGIEVERKPREVTIYNLELLGYEPPLVRLRIACSKGTYIRSLAHDLGQQLGCGAYLDSLVRTKHGPFILSDALTLEQVAELSAEDRLESALLPLDHALQHLYRLDCSAEETLMLIHGRQVPGNPYNIDQAREFVARVHDPEGEFVALASWQPTTQTWKPEKVFVENANNN